MKESSEGNNEAEVSRQSMVYDWIITCLLNVQEGKIVRRNAQRRWRKKDLDYVIADMVLIVR